MDKSIIVSSDQLRGLLKVLLAALALALSPSATWAQQMGSTAQTTQITGLAPAQTGDDGAKLAQEWRALCEQMRTQKLSPEQWISQVESWQNANRARLDAQRIQTQSPKVSQQDIASNKSTQMTQAAVNKDKNLMGDELELANLEGEINQAVQELNASNLGPVERVQAVDDFLKLNKDTFDAVQALRKKIRDARVTKAKTASPVAPAHLSQTQAVSPATQALMTQRDTILNEINAKLDAFNQLALVERIASVDRDKAFIEEHTATLHKIDQQLQTSNK